jgi:hypothetical protein
MSRGPCGHPHGRAIQIEHSAVLLEPPVEL